MFREGTSWFGTCWYIHEHEKYEFKVEFDIPVSYPLSGPEIALPELDGKTAKMYRGGKICLERIFAKLLSNCYTTTYKIIAKFRLKTDHFKPLWSKNVPKFGIAHAMALGLGPWLAVEIPDLVSKGLIQPV